MNNYVDMVERMTEFTVMVQVWYDLNGEQLAYHNENLRKLVSMYMLHNLCKMTKQIYN